MEHMISMEELEKLCDGHASKNEFETLVYHEVLEILNSSTSELWASRSECDKLTFKGNINSCIKILRYWDMFKETE